MNNKNSKFILVKRRKKIQNLKEQIYCITCNHFKTLPKHCFKYCEIRFYHSLYLNYHEILKLYKICLDCQHYFASQCFKNRQNCNCYLSSIYLCNNCNVKAERYIYQNSKCQCDKCYQTYPNLCEDPIYHRICDCEFNVYSEYTEVQ